MSSPSAPFKIFVGYDGREDIAYQVCRHSILRHSSIDVAIIPIRQPVVRELGIYTRPYDETSSTEFSLTRFLAPYLAAESGWIMFCDCDFLFTGDVAPLLEGKDPGKALYLVKHDYEPAQRVKMDGQVQTRYPRKNWSSMMLINCGHPDVIKLTPGVVNSVTAAYLHRFEWLKDDDIGELDLEWNFLEGEYPVPAQPPRVVHFTNGGPWFEQWQHVAFGHLWQAEKALYEAELEKSSLAA